MKKLFTLSLFLLFSLLLGAQVPQMIKFQGIARDPDTQELLKDKNIRVRLSVLKDSPTGAAVYIEGNDGIPVTTGNNGYFSLNLGEDDPADFSVIEWRDDDYFLLVEIDPTGIGNSFSQLGDPQQILSVPYALVADNGKRYNGTYHHEFLVFYGGNGSQNVVIDGTGDFNHGVIAIKNQAGDNSIRLASATYGGSINTYGPNGYRNVELSVLSAADYPNHGAIRVRGEDDNTKAYLFVNSDDAGILNLYGQNGKANVTVTRRSNNPNLGRIGIQDEEGNTQVDLYVKDDGSGYISAGGASGGVKLFVMPHPTIPGKEIAYACIEGPEAGAYERGTAKLINGEAFIPYSDHYRIVINPETVTMVLTPLSADSKGLAVIEKNETGFKVKELSGGTGNYDFDYRVEGVRKGWEDFQVIRDIEPEVHVVQENIEAGND